MGSKQARLTLLRAFLFHCVIAVEFDYWIYNRSVQSTACSGQFKGHPWIAKGVAWPFWQLRTRVYMVLKTSYKIVFFAFLKYTIGSLQACSQYDMISKKLSKRSSLTWASWYRNVYQHKERQLFCADIYVEFKSIGACLWKFPHA